MNSLIRSYKFLKFSTVHQSEKPVSHTILLLRNLQLFPTSSSSNFDDDEKKKKKNSSTTNIADLLNSSCGFPQQEAESLASRLPSPVKKKKTHNVENARDVIQFFRDGDFSDTHIRKVISVNPRVLHSNVDKTLKPKFRAFEELGLSNIEIRDFVVNNMSYLRRDPANLISVLSTLFKNKEDVARVIKRNRFPPTFSCGSNLEPQIAKYLEHGISKEKLARFVTNYPSLILMRPQLIEERIQKAYRMGFKHGGGMLMCAVRVTSSMNESTWESKFQVLRSYGWMDSDIAMAFRKAPYFLSFSTGNMTRTLKFFMEELKYEPFDLASRPTVFSLSLDKRIIPRYTLVKELESRGFSKIKLSLFTLLWWGEKRFQELFLLGVKDEYPDLYESYVKSAFGKA